VEKLIKFVSGGVPGGKGSICLCLGDGRMLAGILTLAAYPDLVAPEVQQLG
jgi:hypothetical protein